MNEQLNAIAEAYEAILSEGKEAKFKVGDKVGIGSFGNYGNYHGNDTGTVTKVNGHGHHTVTYDNRKSSDDHTKPYSELFDHSGHSRKEYSSQRIIPHEDHVKHIENQKEQRERNHDMEHIINHINGNKTGFGNHSKLDKSHAEHLKSLIDKHTKAD